MPHSSTPPTSTGRRPSTRRRSPSTASSAQAAAAVIRGGAALYPTSTATTVRVTGGKGGDVVTTDGPYAETKEALTGFYLLECADLDEAVAIAAKIPAGLGGAVEVRPVHPVRRLTIEDAARAALVRHGAGRGHARAGHARPGHRRSPARRGRRPGRAVRALETWPRDGVARQPAGLADRSPPERRAIDLHPPRDRRGPGRRPRPWRCSTLLAATRSRRTSSATTCSGWSSPAATRRLPLETQVALALRTLCGLSTAEVARALLVPEATMAKRLHPGQAEDRPAPASPTGCPPLTSCPTGCAGVVATVYLIFNEGYAASAGDDPLRPALVEEADAARRGCCWS